MDYSRSSRVAVRVSRWVAAGLAAVVAFAWVAVALVQASSAQTESADQAGALSEPIIAPVQLTFAQADAPTSPQVARELSALADAYVNTSGQHAEADWNQAITAIATGRPAQSDQAQQLVDAATQAAQNTPTTDQPAAASSVRVSVEGRKNGALVVRLMDQGRVLRQLAASAAIELRQGDQTWSFTPAQLVNGAFLPAVCASGRTSIDISVQDTPTTAGVMGALRTSASTTQPDLPAANAEQQLTVPVTAQAHAEVACTQPTQPIEARALPASADSADAMAPAEPETTSDRAANPTPSTATSSAPATSSAATPAATEPDADHFPVATPADDAPDVNHFPVATPDSSGQPTGTSSSTTTQPADTNASSVGNLTVSVNPAGTAGVFPRYAVRYICSDSANGADLADGTLSFADDTTLTIQGLPVGARCAVYLRGNTQATQWTVGGVSRSGEEITWAGQTFPRAVLSAPIAADHDSTVTLVTAQATEEGPGFTLVTQVNGKQLPLDPRFVVDYRCLQTANSQAITGRETVVARELLDSRTIPALSALQAGSSCQLSVAPAIADQGLGQAQVTFDRVSGDGQFTSDAANSRVSFTLGKEPLQVRATVVYSGAATPSGSTTSSSPIIYTSLVGPDGNKLIDASATSAPVTLTAWAGYSDVIAGTPYQIHTTLADADGHPIAGGTATSTFTPSGTPGSRAQGYHKVDVTLPANALEGVDQVVATTTLTKEGDTKDATTDRSTNRATRSVTVVRGTDKAAAPQLSGVLTGKRGEREPIILNTVEQPVDLVNSAVYSGLTSGQGYYLTADLTAGDNSELGVSGWTRFTAKGRRGAAKVTMSLTHDAAAQAVASGKIVSHLELWRADQITVGADGSVAVKAGQKPLAQVGVTADGNQVLAVISIATDDPIDDPENPPAPNPGDTGNTPKPQPTATQPTPKPDPSIEKPSTQPTPKPDPSTDKPSTQPTPKPTANPEPTAPTTTPKPTTTSTPKPTTSAKPSTGNGGTAVKPLDPNQSAGSQTGGSGSGNADTGLIAPGLPRVTYSSAAPIIIYEDEYVAQPSSVSVKSPVLPARSTATRGSRSVQAITPIRPAQPAGGSATTQSATPQTSPSTSEQPEGAVTASASATHPTPLTPSTPRGAASARAKTQTNTSDGDGWLSHKGAQLGLLGVTAIGTIGGGVMLRRRWAK